ncbi:ROK family protein [Streptomyces sp. NRRL F-5123]|uniref:ROK family protein n=1 Tax=Streptomyces sp. NRRL F-5123 TaxID=1463856 RepID=UPI0004E1631D|nr:ROK family protein [Streptomyces sp. NRRL F-5123]
MTAAAAGPAAPVPVLEVGGTHVTAALVAPDTGRPVPSSVIRRPLDSHGTADGILDTVARTGLELPAGHRPCWGVAVPGPFDYDNGIGHYVGVGKFESLSGADVAAGLHRRLGDRAERLCFLNDADAFGLGEYRAGAAAGHDRAVCLTLGTGVGSSFLERGRPVHDDPRVPPEGFVHHLIAHGGPLEDAVSRRAIRARYTRRAALPDGAEVPDVREIAARAQDGDPVAAEAFEYAFGTLGQVLAPWIDRFEATCVVIGGSMARSWELVRTAFTDGLPAANRAAVSVLPAGHPEEAPLIGAAQWAQDAPDPA